jgi:hypothetical protein
VGVVLVLVGLGWDALVHAADAELAHHEHVFTLANPAHVCLLAGVVAVVVGLTGASWQALSIGPDGARTTPGTRTAFLTAMGVTVALTAVTIAWAAGVEGRQSAGLTGAAGSDTHDHGAFGERLQGSGGDCHPTKAQRAAAQRLLADTIAGTSRFRALAAAQAEGYRTGTVPPLPTDHYVSAAAMQDAKVLDPGHPEALMYTQTAKGPVLVGAMYLMNAAGEQGPAIGGCLTRWHVHDNLCFSQSTLQLVGLKSASGQCPSGSVLLVPPAALHVWFVDVPGGRFATDVDAGYLAAKLGP